jgi:hypothetical protein
LRGNGIPFDPNILAVELKQIAKRYIKENINPEIVCFAEK